MDQGLTRMTLSNETAVALRSSGRQLVRRLWQRRLFIKVHKAVLVAGVILRIICVNKPEFWTLEKASIGIWV